MLSERARGGASPMAAVRLAYCDADGTLKLDPDAVEWLRSSLPSPPVGVLAITGPMRTGKSSLLNDLLDSRAAFDVSSATAACTRGLWATTVPAPTWLPTLAGGSLLLLDTEGLGSPDAPSRDPQLFALACILSSVVVYNSFGLIEEVAVARLARLSTVAAQVLCATRGGVEGSGGRASIGRRSSIRVGSDDDVGGSQPRLLWLLRDFHHQLTDASGAAISADSYLESSLMAPPGASDPMAPASPPRSSANSQARAVLRSCFRARSCVALPRPMADVLLAQNNALSAEGRSREWVSGVQQLRLVLSSAMAPKHVEGGALDGASLGELLSRAATLLDEPSTLPADPLAFLGHGLLAAQAERARRLAIAAYALRVSEELPTAHDASRDVPIGRASILAVHRRAKAAALRVFVDVAPFGSRGGGKARLAGDVNDAPAMAVGEENEEEEVRVAAARSMPEWLPARVELRRRRDALLRLDEHVATAHCKRVLGTTAESIAHALGPSNPPHAASEEADEAEDAAIVEVDQSLRPHLEKLFASAAAATQSPLLASGRLSSGDGPSDPSKWEVSWGTVAHEMPLLLQSTSRAAAKAGAGVSIRLGAAAQSTLHHALAKARDEAEAARGEAAVAAAACEELQERLHSYELRETLLHKEVTSLESVASSWHDPQGLVQNLHLETERARKEARLAAVRLDSCEGELEMLNTRFAPDKSAGESAMTIAAEAPSRLGVRPADAMPRGRAVLAAGLNFSAASGADGRLYAWGCGAKGQLGAANPPRRSSWAKMGSPPTTYTANAQRRSGAMTERDEAGGDKSGDAPTPREVVVVGLTSHIAASEQRTSAAGSGRGKPGGVMLLAAASEFALAVDCAGAVWAWGNGKHGELGSGSVGLSGTPRLVRALSTKRIAAIAAGGRHCVAVSASGELYTWGDGRCGQLGHSDTQSRLSPTPVVLLHGRQFSVAACGLEHTVVVSTGGTAFAFGTTRNGRLGIGNDAPQTGRQARPRAVSSTATGRGATEPARITAAACGDAHTLLLTESGRLLACGRGDRGALGLGHPMDAWTPQPVPSLDGVTLRHLAAGSDFSLALSARADGSKAEVYAFGGNSHGQLGLGHTDGPVLVPQLVTRLADHSIVALAAGSAHALALSRSGALFAWGRGTSYQLGMGVPPMSSHGPRLVEQLMVVPPHALGVDGGVPPQLGLSDQTPSAGTKGESSPPSTLGLRAAAEAEALPAARRLAWHESRDRLARHLEKLQLQVAQQRSAAEQAERRLSTLTRDSEVVARRRDELLEEKRAAEAATVEAAAAAAQAQSDAVYWQAQADERQRAAAAARAAEEESEGAQSPQSPASANIAIAAPMAIDEWSSKQRTLSHESAQYELEHALAEAAAAAVRDHDAEVAARAPAASIESLTEAHASRDLAVAQTRALTMEADRLRLEIEKDSLTRKLWEMVDKPGESSGSASSDTRAEVARVWPIVSATFERLTTGVDSLMTRLAQESAERDRA